MTSHFNKLKVKMYANEFGEQFVAKNETFDNWSANLISSMGVMVEEVVRTKTIIDREFTIANPGKIDEVSSSNTSISDSSDEDTVKKKPLGKDKQGDKEQEEKKEQDYYDPNDKERSWDKNKVKKLLHIYESCIDNS